MDGAERPTLSAAAAAGVAVLFQFATFVVGSIAVIPFLTTKGKTVTVDGGLGPVYASFLSAWPVLAVGAYVVARGSGRPWRQAVGLHAVRPVDALGVFVGVALQFIVAAAYVLARVDDDRVSKPARDLTDRAGSFGVGFVILGILVVFGAPLFEEVFYRGAVLGSLRRVADERLSGTLSAALALVVSALWFAGIHRQMLQFPALAAVGLVCGAARMRTGRLATSIAIHFGFNLVTMIALGLDLYRK